MSHSLTARNSRWRSYSRREIRCAGGRKALPPWDQPVPLHLSPLIAASALDESSANKAAERGLFVFRLHVGAGLAHGGDADVEWDAVRPVAVQRQQRRGNRLDRANKSVNRIADNFLPKTRGALMIGGLRDWLTTGLGLKEKISDGYPRTIGPPHRARFMSSEHAAGRVGRTAPLAGKRASKNFPPKISRNPLKKVQFGRGKDPRKSKLFPTP